MAILINDVTPRDQYTATASQTTFTYTFEIFEDTDIVVDIDGTVQTLTTHYTVTGAGVTGGGTVVLVTPAAGGEIVTLYRDVPTERLSDYQTSGDFLAETMNDDLDRIVAMIQQVEEVAGRAFALAITNTGGSNLTVPTPVADGIFAWDDDASDVTYLTGASVTHPYLAACLAAQAAAETAETNAETAETGAQAAETAAQAAQTAAETAYDNFDDRYLGDKASDPALDNDGNALLTGALYFNTTDGEMRVYNGSAWNAATSSIDGVLARFTYTATAGQTAFTGADDNAQTLAFDNGLEFVFLNGAMLKLTTDYTRSGGNTITLTSGATAGDVLEVYAFGNLASGAIGTTVQAWDQNLDDLSAVTSVDTLEQVAAGNLNIGKSLLINGGFDIWQRNTTQTTSGYGSDDRWHNAMAGSTKTHSRQTFTLGQTDVPGGPKYFSRTVVTSVAGAPNYVAKWQNIEGVARTANRQITLSFYAKADASKNMSTVWTQAFGTGGSPSASVINTGTKHALTTSWQKFTETITLPSISGKTLGTNNDDYLSLQFWFDAGTNYDTETNTLGHQSGTFDIANVQLEFGDTATDFEQLPIQHIRDLCYRYYYKSQDTSGAGNHYMPAGPAAAQVWSEAIFPTPMRTAPTFTLYPGVASSANPNTVYDGTTYKAITISVATRDFQQFFITGHGGLNHWWAWYTADAEL